MHDHLNLNRLRLELESNVCVSIFQVFLTHLFDSIYSIVTLVQLLKVVDVIEFFFLSNLAI